MGLQLPANQRSVILGMGGELCEHAFVPAEQFEGDWLTTKREVQKELLECFPGNIQLGWERDLKLNGGIADEDIRLRFLFCFGNGRDCGAGCSISGSTSEPGN